MSGTVSAGSRNKKSDMNKICRLNICTFRRQIIFIDRLFWSKKFEKTLFPFSHFFKNGLISRFSTASTEFSTLQMLRTSLHNIGQGVFYGDYTKNSTELFAPQGFVCGRDESATTRGGGVFLYAQKDTKNALRNQGF
jgi:hypothetical protein